MSRAIYISTGETLQSILDRIAAEGWTDLTKVVLDGDYVSGCSGHSDGEYCYCEGGYADLRFEKRGRS